MAGIAAAPVIIAAAHLFYGAAVMLPALVMSACLFVVLIAALACEPARRDLDRLSPAWLLTGLFGAVLGVAMLTLTPWVPGGGHAIWAWSGGRAAPTLNRSATTLEILKLAGLAAPFLIGCVFGARTDNARRLYACILASGAIYAVVSLIRFTGQDAGTLSGQRLAGGFDSPNIAGTLFGLLTVLALAWGLDAWHETRGRRALNRSAALAPAAALSLLFLACLLLTASRGGMGATGLALAVFAGWAAYDRRQARGPLVVAGVLMTGAAAVIHAQGNTLFLDRLGGLGAEHASRADLLAPHWRAFHDAPLFGVGLGAFPEQNNLIMTPENAEALSATVVLHNVYAQWLVEAGVIGAAPMLALVAVILGATARRGLGRGRNRILIAGLLAASLVVLLHAAVDAPLNTPSLCALWSLLLGLGFAMSQVRRQGDQPGPS